MYHFKLEDDGDLACALGAFRENIVDSGRKTHNERPLHGRFDPFQDVYTIDAADLVGVNFPGDHMTIDDGEMQIGEMEMRKNHVAFQPLGIFLITD